MCRPPAAEIRGMKVHRVPGFGTEEGAMSGTQRLQEMEFELALTGNLEEIYGLRVRADGDQLNRRRSGYTTLCFGYQYESGGASSARVRVEIEGRRRPAYRFEVDLANPDAVESAASDCEALALGIRSYLDEHPASLEAADTRRREDD
jgi:hypothetical protein